MNWKPKYLEKYWYIDSITKNPDFPFDGWKIHVRAAGFCGGESKQHYDEGNCFRKKSEAIKLAQVAVEKIKVILKGTKEKV